MIDKFLNITGSHAWTGLMFLSCIGLCVLLMFYPERIGNDILFILGCLFFVESLVHLTELIRRYVEYKCKRLNA